ncbi:uncharacterized protein FIBRA_07693 [Fibroporia radiculosa]|uniref:Cytochrome P450 n=1 Tax=Fibroporia radiculosa TaxID=599839 RepID=J4I155_9APHY|nr:uncharacterized protein FIBRA_07693 [Fibroporia radiculosa]CCM05472.1 predicted protein [Fibroporia radiculosa]
MSFLLNASLIQVYPGPKPLPFIGNLHQIPKSNHTATFTKWASRYGEVIYMKVISREYIILNSASAAVELLEKRGSLYGSRPQTIMAAELVGRSKAFTLIPYGQRYRMYRKYLRNAISTNSLSEHWAYLEDQSANLLEALLRNPDGFREHIRRSVGAVALRLSYGFQHEDGIDHYINLADELAQITREALEPGRWLVDSLPWLRYVPSWFPGAHFKKWAYWARVRCDEFTNAPFEAAKSNLSNDSTVFSFTSRALQMLEQDGNEPSSEGQDIIKYVSASIYAGGTDTTSSLISTFFLMMACYPEVQRKAQAEIDQITGRSRLPLASDEERLPYLSCVIKELHRIHPTVPLVPRTAEHDDEYRGYRIPKQAYILVNVWAMAHDPTVYPDPNRFNPDRFVSGKDSQPQMDPREISFGLGRRRCPGINLANTVSFLYISRILAMFDILKPLDESGLEYTPEVDFTLEHTS